MDISRPSRPLVSTPLDLVGDLVTLTDRMNFQLSGNMLIEAKLISLHPYGY
jgi:hypothetical protein